MGATKLDKDNILAARRGARNQTATANPRVATVHACENRRTRHQPVGWLQETCPTRTVGKCQPWQPHELAERRIVIGRKSDPRHVARRRELTRPGQAVRVDEMAVRRPQLSGLRVHQSRKGSNTPGVVPGEADRRVVTTMDQHRSQELPLGVDFPWPEPKLRWFNRTIL